jgi:DNA-binding NarL/FixJ family response regulator
VAKAIENQSGISVVTMPPVMADLEAFARRSGPAVLLADPSLLESPSTINVRHLTAHNCLKVLVISEQTESEAFIEYCLRAGCAGVLRGDEPDELCRKAIRAVANGEIWAPRRLLSRLIREAFAVKDSQRLTPRESEIFDLLNRGHSNREIASGLKITKETVRWHLRNVYSKLGVGVRQGAMG